MHNAWSHFLPPQWGSRGLTPLSLWNNAKDVIYIPLMRHNPKQTLKLLLQLPHYAASHSVNTKSEEKA